MNEEAFDKKFEAMTETLLSGMDHLIKDTKLELLDKIAESEDRMIDRLAASENRLLERLASKEDVRDHERRIQHLEEQLG
jgi:hypothetical protein